MASDPFIFDQEKYLQIVKAEGVEAALTELHRETNLWEIEAFEGTAGWRPEMWERLHAVRDFSRKLWEMALDNPAVEKKLHRG